MSVPFPDPIFIRLLADLPVLDELDGRVSTVSLSPLPAIRVVKINDAEAPRREDATPVYQVEVWADDESVAGRLAWALRDAWPTSKKEVVLDGLVLGRWVETGPRPLADPETDLPRYLIDLGIRLSGVSS